LLDREDDDEADEADEAAEWQHAATQRIHSEEVARQQRSTGVCSASRAQLTTQTTSKEALKSIELFNFMVLSSKQVILTAVS